MKPIDSTRVKILLILWLSPTNPDLTMKKIGEIAIKMDQNWKIYALKGNLPYSILNTEKLPCPNEFYPIHIFGSHKNIGSRFLYLLSCIVKGVSLAKKENIQVITQHDGHLEYGLAAYIISRLTRRKCLIRVNEDTLIPLLFFLKSSNNSLFNNKILTNFVTVMYRRIERSFFRRVDWVITHGPMDYEKIKRITNKTTFVPLWIDLNKFRKLEPKAIETLKSKFFDNKSSRSLILFVGRLHPEKGVPTLFEALKLIKHENFLLVMVYSFAEYKKEYEKLAKQLGLSEKILFYGYVPHSELVNFYNSSDLCILPSLREQWSNTIMESMACGTPIIATNVGANPYLIEDGKSGFLVPPNNPEQLAEKIRFVLENKEAVRQVVETAANQVKKYDLNLVGESFKEAVVNLISS